VFTRIYAALYARREAIVDTLDGLVTIFVLCYVDYAISESRSRYAQNRAAGIVGDSPKVAGK
jgi:hypothetical protein